jgi:hypothetical protein
MSRDNQREWPPVRENGTERRSPTAFYNVPNGYFKQSRSLVGPLRMGTEPTVGPRGAVRNGSSDMGLDRITPRGFDPIGTALDRYGPQESSPLISRELRSSNRRKED